MPHFESRTDLNSSPEVVFEYLRRPANLQAIAPPESQLVFVQAPEIIDLGARLVCKVLTNGMIQQLAYDIIEFESPVRYREKMVEGPLQLWLHDYIVESNPTGGVTLVNRIEFAPPSGMLGLIVTERRIVEALEDGFDYRAKALKRVFA